MELYAREFYATTLKPPKDVYWGEIYQIYIIKVTTRVTSDLFFLYIMYDSLEYKKGVFDHQSTYILSKWGSEALYAMYV